ncbi:LOW QUALITY PROTEIN: hypothetical protein, conserved [Eimeria necatrix]|uniref:AP2/ERF domain-containing protein n=1 Tax=Eimeria necatrix TaxID=51315 RepID=U6MNT7_9EIME|nr:LOW QUALITY PROTEIN: hypothetical protein, conserved [Eimeria necatrix]CDJ64114.1 hypothetical protein, conserved [Eimeria necatrix]
MPKLGFWGSCRIPRPAFNIFLVPSKSLITLPFPFAPCLLREESDSSVGGRSRRTLPPLQHSSRHMHRGGCVEPSAPTSVEESRSLTLDGEFLTDEASAVSARRGTQRTIGPTGGGALKRLRGLSEEDSVSVEDKTSPKTPGTLASGEKERWRLLEQLSQVIPTAGSLLPEAGPSSNQCVDISKSGESETLDWEACNRALDRLVRASKPQSNVDVDWDTGPSSITRDLGLFDVPQGASSDVHDSPGTYTQEHNDHLAALVGAPSDGSSVFVAKGGQGVKRSNSNAADPMKERQRRELQQRRTLDLASQIVSRFRGARRPGVLQLVHRFFSCSSRQVRDPQELEKLVGACCYIIARQQGDDMTLNDVTAQLERRQGTKGKQRCRCISRWVVKVCGKLQLRCLPRHGDVEVLASNALRRICGHLKMLLTQQEQQELLLLQSLKEAYRQCLQQDATETHDGKSNQQQQKDTALAELDDEDLLGLLLLQQQEEAAANAPAIEVGSGSTGEDGLPDLCNFLEQFDRDCSAKKVQIEDEAWNQPTAAVDREVSLGADGSMQLAVPTGRREGNTDSCSSKWDTVGPSDVQLLGQQASDPAILDAQIQQHECVLRLLRLLPSAQRIKLDHSIWLQKQRKAALQQLREQSAIVIKCVGLLQQLTNVAFAAAAKRGCLPAPSVASEECGKETEASEGLHAEAQHIDAQLGMRVEGEDPLDEHWRACGRCDAISTAAHFVIVFECLQVPVFQRVVLEALEVDRRSVYKRRREQLHVVLSIFRKLPGAEDATVKRLGALLLNAINNPETTKKLLHIAETVPLRAPAREGLDALSEERSSASGQTSGPHSSQTQSRCSTEDVNSRSSGNNRGHSPVRTALPAASARPTAAPGGTLTPKDLCAAETISSAAAAAALKELEEGDPVLAETPMARVVSLQYERTQQRWVCKWREGLGTGGRWHRRCFSVVKYGEDGAHTLAAAVAKKLRDRRSQEASGMKFSSTTSSDISPVVVDFNSSGGVSKRGTRGATASEPAAHNSHTAGVTSRIRNRRTAAGSFTAATAASFEEAAIRQDANSYSLSHLGESNRDSLIANMPTDPNLSSVVASAAYSDEMERLAQLLQKARNNPLLAKWLDERAPPPGAAALRAAAESIVPFLALQTEADKVSAAVPVPFGQKQSLPRRGRVAGAREGM